MDLVHIVYHTKGLECVTGLKGRGGGRGGVIGGDGDGSSGGDVFLHPLRHLLAVGYAIVYNRNTLCTHHNTYIHTYNIKYMFIHIVQTLC